MKLLTISSVSLTYHSKKSETLALDNLSFDVNDGEFVSIVGPSGCGKTTILSLICGLIKPTNGEIFVDQTKVTKPNSKVGYMLQRDNLFEWLTIEKNVLLGLEIMHKKNKDTISRAKDLLQKYGLSDFASHYPSELSGGMRQRVALIRTLATSPNILLLDEPCSALDYQTRLVVQEDIFNIISQEKKTAVLVTHDITEAISMSDRIIILSDRPGKVKKIIKLNYGKMSPFKRRKTPEFSKYFDMVWRELV